MDSPHADPQVTETILKVTKDILKLFDEIEALNDRLLVAEEQSIKQMSSLSERMGVWESCTETWDGRFEDLERWQIEIDDEREKGK